MLNLVFPKTCYICHKEGEYLCSNCFQKYIRVDPINRCHCCNKECRIGFVHSECAQYSYLDGVLNLTMYENLIKKMIYDIKYNFHFSVTQTWGKIMADYLRYYNFKKEDTVVTFVPTSRKKFKMRGFNQSQLLAKFASKHSGVELIGVLEKRKNTGAQAKLHKIGRAENLKDVFKFVDQIEHKNSSIKNIIIVDDVFTTGATLNECAKEIKKHMDVKVFGFVIAKARG